MQKLARFLALSALAALLISALPPGEASAAAEAPPTVLPGLDSQVFRPETPGYRIKKDQDKVEEYMKVPPPPAELEKKKDEKPQEEK
jgi:hypothetical protein